MNYFPYLVDFKNINQYNSLYSSQYGYYRPFLIQNDLSFYPTQQNPEIQINNNHFNQNFIQKFPQQQKIQSSPEFLECPKSQQCLDEIKNKNNLNKGKTQRIVFKQKQGRNMISNLFKQAIGCIIEESEKTTQVIERISDKYNIQVNAREFLDNLSKKTRNLKNYVRIGQIQSLLKEEQNSKSKWNSKVLRILVHRFLRQDSITCLCNNSKIHCFNRLIHISERRNLHSLISS